MTERRVALSDLSDLAWDYSLISERVEGLSVPARILVVEFAGHYRHGHDGKGDARLMVAVIMAGLWAWEADALVLDLSAVGYDWGEDMVQALTMGAMPPWSHRDLKTVCVTSPANRNALAGLVDDVLGENPDMLLVQDRSRAVKKILKRLKSKYSRSPR